VEIHDRLGDNFRAVLRLQKIFPCQNSEFCADKVQIHLFSGQDLGEQVVMRSY